MKSKLKKQQTLQTQQPAIQDSPAKQIAQWFTAVINEDLPTMDRLLAQGFDISTPFPNELTDEMLAHLNPKMQIVFISMVSMHQQMRAATPVEIRDDFSNMQAIHIATSYNRTKLLQHLISKGVNMSAQIIGGLTALHIASQQEGGSALQILLSNKANLSVQSLDHAKPVHFAAQNRNIINLHKLLDSGAYHDDILDQRTLVKPAYISKDGETAKDFLEKECKKYFARAEDIANRLHTEGKYQEAVVHFKAALGNQVSIKSASSGAAADEASAPDVAFDVFSRGKLEALCAKNYHMLIIEDLVELEDLAHTMVFELYKRAIASLKRALVDDQQNPEIYIALGKTHANYGKLKQKELQHDVQDYIKDAQPNFPCSAAALLENELKFLSPYNSYESSVSAVNALTKAESLRVSQESGGLLKKYTSERDQALLKIQTTKEQLITKYTKLKDAFPDEDHKAYCAIVISLIDKRFEMEMIARSSEFFELDEFCENMAMLTSNMISLFAQDKVKKTDQAFREIDKAFKKNMKQISREYIADPEKTYSMGFGLSKLMLAWNACKQETISHADNTIQILNEALEHFKIAAEIDKIVQSQTPKPDSVFHLKSVPKLLKNFKARVAEERAAATADDFAHDQELPDDAAGSMPQQERIMSDLEVGCEVTATGATKDFEV